MELKITNADKLNLSELESAVRAFKIAVNDKLTFNAKRVIRNDNKDYGCLACSFEVRRTGKNYIVSKID